MMYWDRKTETISKKELEKVQLERLQQTIKKLYENVPFYRGKFDAAGIKPKDVKTLKDITKLPFTNSSDLRDNYPDGMNAVPRSKIIRLHTSSGTTGKPKAIYFSRKDIETAADLCARCMMMTGMTDEDVFQNMMTYGLFTGALMTHYGAEKVGALVVPAGPGNSERQISLMQDFKTTTIHLTPSYGLYIGDVMEKMGINPKKDLSLKRAYVGAEPYTEETRRKIEKAYNIDVYNCYGLSEMNGPGVGFECLEKNGLHIWEDNFILEIIDPETMLPVEDGKSGEMVLTSINREAMPLLRYRVRDITSVIPGKCKCGRTHRRINRITGRSDDMFIVRGVNIFPQQIERILMGIAAVGKNYQIMLEGMDATTVRVEIAREVFDGNVEHLVNLQEEITRKLQAEILIKPKVELLEPGTLPAFEGKAKRVIDKRKL